MFPLEARVVRRGACVCSVFMSGMDFFMRRDWAMEGDGGWCGRVWDEEGEGGG